MRRPRKPDLKPGDWVRLTASMEDPNPVLKGTRGQVTDEPMWAINGWIVHVKWTTGSTLNLLVPPDRYKKVEGP